MIKLIHYNGLAWLFLQICVIQSVLSVPHQEDQSLIINNEIVQSELVDCQNLYDAIKPILDKYKRPITVLDLGAGEGYFSFRIAQEYDATCIMVESNRPATKRADLLLKLCQLNSHLKNVALLNKKISYQEMEKLADCEHFDVVLAFDYIDDKNINWKKILNAILRLGDNIFIQTPHSKINPATNETSKIVKILAGKGGQLISQSTQTLDPKTDELLFRFEKQKKALRCKCFAWDSSDAYMELFQIKSSYTNKIFLKKGKTTGPEWKRGINLATFLMLNGVYPSRETLKQKVAELIKEKLTDFAPWNIIVQGEAITLIDQGNKSYQINLKTSLNYINKVIDQKSSLDIERLCNNVHKRHLTTSTWSWMSRLF